MIYSIYKSGSLYVLDISLAVHLHCWHPSSRQDQTRPRPLAKTRPDLASPNFLINFSNEYFTWEWWVFSKVTRLNHNISCVWIFLHFPLRLYWLQYWLLQILQLSSFSWLGLGEKNTFPNPITSEIKLQFRAINKMLNRTLKVKFLHKMLRDLLQYVQ